MFGATRYLLMMSTATESPSCAAAGVGEVKSRARAMQAAPVAAPREVRLSRVTTDLP